MNKKQKRQDYDGSNFLRLYIGVKALRQKAALTSIFIALTCKFIWLGYHSHLCNKFLTSFYGLAPIILPKLMNSFSGFCGIRDNYIFPPLTLWGISSLCLYI